MPPIAAFVAFHCAGSPASACLSPPMARRLIVRSCSADVRYRRIGTLERFVWAAKVRADWPAETREPVTDPPVISNAALGINAIASTRVRMLDVHLLRRTGLRRPVLARRSLLIDACTYSRLGGR